MEKNKKYIKPKSARKNLEKNNNKNIININSHSSNNKDVKKIKKIAKNIYPKTRLYSYNSNENFKTDFEKEYDKLENLCNRKSNRNKLEIINYIADQKKKMKKEKEEKKSKNYKLFKKMYKNYQKLERDIKTINIVNKIKKTQEKENKKEDNPNEKSNGSIENNKFNKKYYYGCLDVKRILSKDNFLNKKQ